MFSAWHTPSKIGPHFVSRMYVTAAKVRWLLFHTRLNRGFCSDLQWWNMFITRWNGISLLSNTTSANMYDYQMQMDATGSWGCGACFNGKWFQLHWSSDWHSINGKRAGSHHITYLVLFGTKHCQGTRRSSGVKKDSSNDPMTMHLLRCLWFLTATFDMEISVSHIPEILNSSADFLSRN